MASDYWVRDGVLTRAIYRAEYILQVIGAGATATTDRDWHSVWMDSAEAQAVQKEIETIHTEGRKKPPVQTNLQTTYATSWGYQTWTLFQRDCQGNAFNSRTAMQTREDGI